MDELYQLIAAAEAAAAKAEALEVRVADLEQENDMLRRRLGITGPAEDAPLTVYSKVEDIDWAAERLEDNDETRTKHNGLFVRWGMTGAKEVSWYPPYKHVIVDGEGELRHVPGGWNPDKKRGGISASDAYCIAALRIENLLAEQWCAYVQEGDGSTEEDPADQKALLRRYVEKGHGFRYSPSLWQYTDLGRMLLEVWQELRPGEPLPEPATTTTPISVTPVPGALT